jgi:hypothetical protein
MARRAAFIILMLSTFTGAQVTVNVIQRVFLIKGPTDAGTAFTIDVEGRQYLVTAKHVVKGLGTDGTIQVVRNGEWSPLVVKVFRCDEPVDIAVLVPPAQLSVSLALEPSSDGMLFGGEMYFLGFPYAQATSVNLAGGYPLPLIKKATLSGMDSLGPGKGSVIVLDGYNNPGFSGSPGVFRDERSHALKVAGVVVSFRSEAGPVLKTELISSGQVSEDDLRESRILDYRGKVYRVIQETTDFVRLNTGIAFAHEISFAVALIKQHPIGPVVNDTFQPK